MYEAVIALVASILAIEPGQIIEAHKYGSEAHICFAPPSVWDGYTPSWFDQLLFYQDDEPTACPRDPDKLHVSCSARDIDNILRMFPYRPAGGVILQD